MFTTSYLLLIYVCLININFAKEVFSQGINKYLQKSQKYLVGEMDFVKFL